jgi:ABC-type uncharacterized transport system substrate-binding protein
LDERIMAGEVRVTRRRHILAAGGAFLLLAAARAQTPKRFRVACLWANDPESIASLEKAFVDGLREQGYVVGRNLVLDMRYARGDNSRMPALADELIGLRPDVVIGIESVAIVMRSKTKSIPIVLIASPNPVAAGLVRTLGRPRVALLNYAAPAGDPGAQSVADAEQVARAAAARKGLTLLVAGVSDADSVRAAFAEIERQRSDAIVVAATATT